MTPRARRTSARSSARSARGRRTTNAARGARPAPPARKTSRKRAAQKKPVAAAPAIDIMVESPRWKAERGVATVLRRAIAVTAALVPTKPGELAIVLTDDSAIRALNRAWRRKDAPTNVLSFPARDICGGRDGGGAPRVLGDIVIAYETTAREAKTEGKPLRHHLAHLAVHGFLHLAGYDHETDVEAEAMERLEIVILARLKIPNPYAARQS